MQSRFFRHPRAALRPPRSTALAGQCARCLNAGNARDEPFPILCLATFKLEIPQRQLAAGRDAHPTPAETLLQENRGGKHDAETRS